MARLPYTNFHDINLDWLIKRVMKTVQSVNGKTGVVILTGGDIPFSEDFQQATILDFCDYALEALDDLNNQMYGKQEAPALMGTAGQFFKLDSGLNPVWSDLPIASTSIPGIAQASLINGIGVDANGILYIFTAPNTTIKTGTNDKQPITPSNQDRAVYYGLSKIAGYDLANVSPLTPGVYPDAAIDKILTMLGVYNRILSPAGNTHTLLPCPFSYAFGEKATLTVTVTATSEYHFSFSCPSGSPTNLTINGATGTAGDVILEAGEYYEVNVWNGLALYHKIEVTPG